MIFDKRKKELALRFVEIVKGKSLDDLKEDRKKKFALQKRTFLGWKVFTHAIGGSPAGVAYGAYTDTSKDKLIDTVLRSEYNTSVEHCNLTIYPTIIQM